MDFENGPGSENPEKAERNRVVKFLVENLEKCGFQEDFQGEAASARKEKLIRIAMRLPDIGDRILRKFKELAQAEGLDTNSVAFFSVGGRVLGTPIKESTDFDVVITSEHKLTPFAEEPTITFAQRHAIGNALYAEMETVFASLGLSDEYEKGIIEIKGLGERTAEEVEKETDVLRITERKSP